MILFLSITLICIFFIMVDLVPIYQKKQWWVFGVYSTMLVFIYILTILIALNVNIPSPANPLKKIVSVIWGL
jgi:hypothetical protein